MKISEVVIYKTITQKELEELFSLHYENGSVKIGDRITATKLLDGRIEFEIIERDYEVDA